MPCARTERTTASPPLINGMRSLRLRLQRSLEKRDLCVRRTRSAPSPRAPGLPGSRLVPAQVGQARLALGEGRGGGSSLLHAVCPPTDTAHPNPSPQGSEFKHGLENSFRDFNKLFGISQEPSSADCI